MGKNPFKLAGLPGGICVTMLPLSLRLDCEQSLFSSETGGKTQTKRGSVTVTVTALSVLRAARGIAAPTSRLQSRSHAYLFCVLPHRFSTKRETACRLA